MSFEKHGTKTDTLLELGYDQIAAFDEQATRGEALAYYDNSQIEDAVVYKNKISGRVGNYFENYSVKVIVHENEIASTCECENERKICRHAIALLYAWANDSQDFLNLSHVLKDIAKLPKKRLVEIVTNILKIEPHLAQVFLQKREIDWDEIDTEPDTL